MLPRRRFHPQTGRTVVSTNAAEVLNLVGFITGTVLYAMLLALVLRDSGARNPSTSALPLATALLGLVWNLGELTAFALPKLGYLEYSVGLWATAFPALGLLAAVVVHSVARDLPNGGLVTSVAYACSTAASVLHIQTVLTGDPNASSLAFVVLTICYTGIIVALAALTRGQPNGSRILWIVALAMFAVSASHLGREHGGDESWAIELVGHHAAIPLAFAILYQDYRFALADLFLKRALTLLALVAFAFTGYSLTAALTPGPITTGLGLILWVGTALVMPSLHRGVTALVDVLLLRRVDYRDLNARMAGALQNGASIEQVLDTLCEQLRTALNASRVWWMEGDSPETADAGVTARASVDTTEHPPYLVKVGELMDGRRLLSDDLALIDAAVNIAARRIDQLRLTHERYEVELRAQRMQKLTAEAELKALRAQINPHFLFNALTTIGYLIEAAPPRALSTLMQLTGLLRGVLRSDGEMTTLGRETELVEHYLRIEAERFQERLTVTVDVPDALRQNHVPALTLQPLVDNAIKHGIAKSTAGGRVAIRADCECHSGESRLKIEVRNSGAPLSRAVDTGDRVGLDNVRRRLMALYGPNASLELATASDGDTLAILMLPASVNEEEKLADVKAVESRRRR